jgi:hypothetical protein
MELIAAPKDTFSILPVVKALEDTYNYFRVAIFQGKIAGNVVITVQSNGRRKNALGWFAPSRWVAGETKVHEINVSAEYLKRDPKDILLTVAHEGIHHFARETGVIDTSNNGSYHNKRFKALAEEYGFLPPSSPDPRIGYSAVMFGTNLAALDRLPPGIIETITNAMARVSMDGAKGGKKGNMFLYVCPCGVKARVGHDHANLRCDDCGDPFECRG